MHLTGIFIFILISLFWLVHGLRVAWSALQLPRLKNSPPAADFDCARVSLLFAARDEEEKLRPALATLARLDYPLLEIIAVNDRSADATEEILKEAANRDSRMKVVNVEALPEGWLGKPHALQRAYEASTGDWLLFTDADVHFRADTLRRAMTLVRAAKLDHLTLMCDVEMHGFWEKTTLTFFALGFYLATNPQAVFDPRSRAYLGIGAFQLVRRGAYERSGMHKRLAMEILDDMKLGKIVKQAGFRSGAGIAGDYVSVRWHAGLRNIVRGVTKNFFASANFSLRTVALQLAGIFCTDFLPFLALPFVRGWTLSLALISVMIALAFHTATAIVTRTSPFNAMTHPHGAAIYSYMLLHSTVTTLRQGGVVWRGTFYPLEQLRRGLI